MEINYPMRWYFQNIFPKYFSIADGNKDIRCKGIYSADKFRGTLIGTEEVSGSGVRDFFTVAPLTHDRWTGEVNVRLGLTDFATL